MLPVTKNTTTVGGTHCGPHAPLRFVLVLVLLAVMVVFVVAGMFL